MSKGISRAHHELEISHFIKYQKFMRTMMRTLFSDMERFLIRNQYSTVLDSSSESAGASSSGSDVTEHKFVNILREKDSIFTIGLLKGAFKRQGKHAEEDTEEATARRDKKPSSKKQPAKLESYDVEDEVTHDQLVVGRGQKRQWKSKPKRSQTERHIKDAQVLYEEPEGIDRTRQTLEYKKHYQVNAPLYELT